MKKSPEKHDSVAMIDLENFFPFIVTTVTRLFHALMEKEFKEFGINIAEWRILICLSRHKSCTLNDVVKFTVLPQSTLSRAINRMEKKRLLSISKLSSDGRLLNIRLTRHGLEILRLANSAAQRAVEKNISTLTKAEQKTLMASMKRLVRIMDPGNFE